MVPQMEVDRLNADCACVTLDRDALAHAAEAAVGDPAFARDLALTHPHLMSAQPMFLSASNAARIKASFRPWSMSLSCHHTRRPFLSALLK